MGTQVLLAFPGGPEKPKLLSVVFALLEEADSPLVYVPARSLSSPGAGIASPAGCAGGWDSFLAVLGG